MGFGFFDQSRDSLDSRGLSPASFSTRRARKRELLDEQRSGWEQGRPGSEQGMWSENDRRMLIALLDLRERQRSEANGPFLLSNLGNFIVWSWVYYDGFVELEQAKRVSSLGRVAASIAHEFNNILMGIQPNIEVIQRSSPSGLESLPPW